MPRNRSKRKSTKSAPAPEVPRRIASPSSAEVIDRIANYEGGYLADNFARILSASFNLADEPEFADLTFPPEKTFQITQEVVGKYAARLVGAIEADDEDEAEVVDEMRSEVIERLTTPYFRKEVMKRLERLEDRLLAGDDPERFEVAVVLSQLMKMEKLPWGIVGLILAIYQRTMSQDSDDQEAAEEVLSDVLIELEKGRAPMDVVSDDRLWEKAERFKKKLADAPELWDGIKQGAQESLKEFELAILGGDVDISLFSKEELDFAFDRVEKVRIAPEDAPDDAEKLELKKLTLAAGEVLTELMSPERIQEFIGDVNRLSGEWLREGHPWASHLMAEISGQAGQPGLNPHFLMIVYLGQLLAARAGAEAQE